jgi:aspartokinase
VVVTSALPKVTDLLLEPRTSRPPGRTRPDRLRELGTLHEEVVEELFRRAPRRRLRPTSEQEELRTFCTAVYALEELTPRTLDAVAAIGERLSSEIVAEALVQEGLRAELVDARTLVITDEAFGNASPQLSEMAPRVRLKLKPMIDGAPA